MMLHVVVNRVFSNDFNGYKRDPGFIINNQSHKAQFEEEAGRHGA